MRILDGTKVKIWTHVENNSLCILREIDDEYIFKIN